MIKLFALTPTVDDGAAICRVHAYKYMSEVGYPIHTQLSSQISSYDIEWADVVVMHRPIDHMSAEIAKQIKLKKKLLIVDNDDAYFDIPIDHIAHITYSKQDLRDRIIETTSLADVVTVSNDELKSSFEKYNSNITTYPCTYDERFLKPPEFTPRNKVILWRGSKTHNQSLCDFADSIGELDKQHTGWTFHFVGDYPWQVLKKIKNNSWYCNPDYMPTKTMWEYCRGLNPAIQIVPLTDNYFTKCRSNMALMDATTAGALTVARSFKHFMVPGVVNYQSEKDFEEIMHRLMDTMPEQCESQAFKSRINDSWKYIEETLTFKAVSPILFNIVKSLMGNVL